jgi:hypothetical protein
VKSAAHSSASPEHGTPTEFIELAKHALGPIYMDPSSSSRWNMRVGAYRYITKEEDGLIQPWFPGAPQPNTPNMERVSRDYTAFVNPPGEPTGHLVARFWSALAAYYVAGWCKSAIWIGFNIEQMARLQRVGAACHPLQFPTLVPSMRARYINRDGRPNDTPHSSFVTLLSDSIEQIERFHAEAKKFGHVIIAT